MKCIGGIKKVVSIQSGWIGARCHCSGELDQS